MATTKDEPTVASAGKAIQELLEANKAAMEAWYAQHGIEQRAKAEEIVKLVAAARQKRRAVG